VCILAWVVGVVGAVGEASGISVEVLDERRSGLEEGE